LEPYPEPKNLDAWSWSPKFEFRLHSPGSDESQDIAARSLAFLLGAVDETIPKTKTYLTIHRKSANG